MDEDLIQVALEIEREKFKRTGRSWLLLNDIEILDGEALKAIQKEFGCLPAPP